jgi:hypothetical protein
MGHLDKKLPKRLVCSGDGEILKADNSDGTAEKSLQARKLAL